MTASALMLRTMGHASIALYEQGGCPILLTDPWLVGSVYWRSWWLQNYPSPDELDWLAKSERVYVTHEHPDHFHMPSIRRLGAGPRYLFPALSEQVFLEYMTQQDFRAEVLPALAWQSLSDRVSILSIPTWNDDSLLIIDTPSALILNFNDAKPLSSVVKAIRRLAERSAKPKVLLCSYSPASLVNSFSDQSGALKLKEPRQYVDYVSRLCDRVGADVYLPFASQAVFNRDDSRWANEHSTTYGDLQNHWSARAQLLPPYTTLNLDDLSSQTVPPADYRTIDPARIRALTRKRVEVEQIATIDADDVAGLLRKINASRWFWRVLFPRGFCFLLGDRRLKYDPWRGTLANTAADSGDFVITVPKLAMKEAIRNNHVSDLGITMFVRVHLLRRINPMKVYGLFVLLMLDDYGHLSSFGALWHWLRSALKWSFGLRLPVPDGSRAQAASNLRLT
jgi:hypothetical protein